MTDTTKNDSVEQKKKKTFEQMDVQECLQSIAKSMEKLSNNIKSVQGK